MAPPPQNVHVEIEINASLQNQAVASAAIAAVPITAAVTTLFAVITSDSTTTSAGKIVRTIEMYIPPTSRSSWGNSAQQERVILDALLGPIGMRSASSPKVRAIVLS